MSRCSRPIRAALAAAAALPLLAACGGGLDADTSCRDYLKTAADERHDAAVSISSDLGVPNAGNPMWGLSLDGACGARPGASIRDIFENTQ